MKRFLVLLVTSFCLTHVYAKERIVHLPSFTAWSSTTIEIEKIVLSDTATIFHLDAFYPAGRWIKIVSDTYLLDRAGKKYTVRSGIGISLNEEYYMPESGTHSFQLVFPPISEDLKEISFIEGEEEGAFNIWGIRLDGKPVTSLLAGRKNPMEKAIPEIPALAPGVARLKGRIAHYLPQMQMKGQVVATNILTEARNEYPLEVEADGSFRVDIPLLSATAVSMRAPFYTGNLYLEPGGETYMEVNLPEIARSASRFRVEEPSLGEKYYFTGNYAALNNEVSNHSLRYLSVSPNNEQEYIELMNDIYLLDAEGFREYWINKYTQAVEVLNAYPDMSDAYRQLLLLGAKVEVAENLLSAPYMIEAAYQMVNGLERGAPMPEEVKPVFPRAYYMGLREFIPVEGELLYHAYIFYLLSGLSYLNDQDSRSEELPSLVEIIGTDRGLLFDLLAAKEILKPIKEFTPLTDEQLIELEEVSPVMKEIVLAENNTLLAKIEANEKKTGYSLGSVALEDIPEDELFVSILQPYKGKVVFVDFWATWCGPCIQAFKTSAETKKEMEEKGVVFLYIAGENSPKGNWADMISDIKGEHYRLTDAQWEYICKFFNIEGIPTYMVVDKDGTLAHLRTGFPGEAWMKDVLTKALDKE